MQKEGTKRDRGKDARPRIEKRERKGESAVINK